MINSKQPMRICEGLVCNVALIAFGNQGEVATCIFGGDFATCIFVVVFQRPNVLSIPCRRFGGPRGGESPVGFHHHKVFHHGAQLRDAFDDVVAVRGLVRGFGRGVGRPVGRGFGAQFRWSSRGACRLKCCGAVRLEDSVCAFSGGHGSRSGC